MAFVDFLAINIRASAFYQQTDHCARRGTNGDDFWGIGGLWTIFFSGVFIDDRRFFCLDVVNNFDFYHIN